MSRCSLPTSLIVTATVVLLIPLGIGSFASANPLPGEPLNFLRWPLNGGDPGVYSQPDVPLAADTAAAFLAQDEPCAVATTDGGLYEFNAELSWLAETFPDTFASSTLDTDPLEWISIVSLVFPSPGATPQWGWHDRDYGITGSDLPAGAESACPYHLLDDAVSGSYSPSYYLSSYDQISSSMGLAFSSYIVPEPATLGY